MRSKTTEINGASSRRRDPRRSLKGTRELPLTRSGPVGQEIEPPSEHDVPTSQAPFGDPCVIWCLS